jgi:hypothetical protein
MKLRFINPASLDKNLKATVHKSGKLGFTVEAANKLKLQAFKSASIAINDEDPTDTSLYMIINDTIVDSSFKINKAGEYYYINTKALFDDMKIDYLNRSVVYDISVEQIDQLQVFKLKRRREKEEKDSLSQ